MSAAPLPRPLTGAVLAALLVAAAGVPMSAPLASDDSRTTVIRSHRAALVLYPDSREIVCTDTLEILLSTPAKGATGGENRAEGDPRAVRLNLASIYQVERFEVNGRETEFEFEAVAGALTFERPGADSVLEAVISYRGHLPGRSEFSMLAPTRTILREEEVFPWAEREFRHVRIALTVPRGWSAAGPGKTVSVDSSGDLATFVFEETEPLPIIGWICAGEYRPVRLDSAGYSVTVHRFGEDSGMAARLAGSAVRILEFYSGAFSPYRFPRLDIMEVDDWLAGPGVLAIAGPSFVLMKHSAFTTTDDFNSAPTVLAHEIAHQWWPGAVFCTNEEAPLLSEGLSEYSSRIYGEHAGRLGPRDSLAAHPLLQPLLTRTLEQGGRPLRGEFDMRSEPTHYLKAAYVHQMLRSIVGPDRYAEALRSYATDRRFGYGSIGLFREAVSKQSADDLGWFFNQWIEGRAIPTLRIYNVRSTESARGGDGRPARWKVEGRLRMLGYDKLTAIAVVRATTETGHADDTVRVGSTPGGAYRNDVPFSMELDAKPLRVELDPDGDLLKMRKLPVKLGSLRDPDDGMLVLGTGGGGEVSPERLRELAAEDSVTLVRYGWSVRLVPDTAVSLGDLQRRRVFLYGDSSSNSILPGFLDRFPKRLDRGEFLEARKSADDLVLIQAIENPHNNYGTAVWICPSGPASPAALKPVDRSWALMRGEEEVVGGTWDAVDPNLVVEIPR